MKNQRLWRGTQAGLSALTASAMLAVGLVVLAPVQVADAVSGSDFNPGMIISDSEFYNSAAMTQSEIQSFLQSNGSVLTGLTFSVASRARTVSTVTGNLRCDTFTGGTGLLASEIIYRAQTACGISAKVILVTLQKEQGLVQRSSAGQSALDRAMGMACPDTAPCATESLGFGNQVYMGTLQLNTYKASHFAMQPGVHSILFNPNSACGSSSVNVSNYATAALYNYTPYQPNAAALAAYPGIGDGCSSYGNRNFWFLYNTWFGNSLGSSILVRTVTDPTVYLITDTTKYPIHTTPLFESLQALGPIRYVTQESLDSLALGQEANTLLRDSTTGEIYLAADGVKHKFTTCALVEEYFGTCYHFIDLPSAQLWKFSTGSEMTQFSSSLSTGTRYYISGNTKSAIYSSESLSALAHGGSTAIVAVRQLILDTIPDGPAVVSAGMFITSGSSPDLYLTTGPNSAIPVSLPSLTAAFGITPVSTSAETLPALTITGPALTPAVTCDGSVFVAGGGMLWPESFSYGLPTTTLNSDTCAALPKSTAAAAGALFLRVPSTGFIYNVANGKKVFMATMANITAIIGTASLSWVPTDQSILDTIPDGVATLAPASLVRSANAPTVYLVDGASKKIPVPSFALTDEFGISGYTIQSDATLAAYSTSSTSLTPTVSCDGGTFIAGGGKLWPVPSSFGLPTTVLDSATCAKLTKASTGVSGVLFLRVPSNGYIYNIVNGKKTFMATMAQVNSANGGAPLVWIPMSQTVLDSIPTDVAVLSATSLVRSANAPTVYLVDGASKKIPVPSFALTDEFGISGYTIQSDATLAAYSTSSTSLTPTVSCDGGTFIAGGGKLWPVPSSFGLPTTVLDSATCAKLTKASTGVSGVLFLRVPSNGYIYNIVNGKKTFMATMAQVNSANGGAPLVWIPMSQTVLDGIPNA